MLWCLDPAVFSSQPVRRGVQCMPPLLQNWDVERVGEASTSCQTEATSETSDMAQLLEVVKLSNEFLTLLADAEIACSWC